MENDVASFLAQFKALVSEITKDKAATNTSWVSYLDSGVRLCDALPDNDCMKPEHGDACCEIENLAIGLWNFSVTMKTKGHGSSSSNAKIRHMAFWVLEFCGKQSEADTSLRRLVMMGLKCGRAWLDASLAEMADRVLSKTEKCVQRLQKVIMERRCDMEGDGSTQDVQGLDKHKLDLEQDLFTLLCYRAETCIQVEKLDEALQHMMLAKELVPKFPKQAGFLCMLCYNTGVELYQRKVYSQSIIWLRESYELGKNMTSIGSRNQARTLRLLANVYLDYKPEENIQNALNAVSLANTEHCHPAGLFLKVKILMIQKADDNVVKRSVEELIKLPELTVDLSLHTLQLVKQHNRLELVIWLIEELMKKFEHTPELAKLLVTNTEVLIEANMIKEVKEFLEFCITANHTGRPIEFSAKKRFHTLFWEQAAVAFEKEEYQEAVEWYNYSVSLYTQSDAGDLTLAKLHRNRANCYIHLQLNDKAKDAVAESLKYDPTCVHAYFIQFKLAIAEDDSSKACECLHKICELSSSDTPADDGDKQTKLGLTLVALAAQQALESDKLEAACVALQHVANSSSDPEQVLKALRCLVRLKLAAADKDPSDRSDISEIIKHIKTGLTTLTSLQDNDKCISQLVQVEADWFMKIAWNMALQCESRPSQMKQLYVVCSQLLLLGIQDEGSLSRQMTCTLMAAAACLQMARANAVNDVRMEVLKECLDHLAACQQLCNRIQQHSITDGRNKETEVLLLLYEFEARIHLKDPTVENILEKALTMVGPDPKTFETLAAIAIEAPACNKSIAVRSLKVAIRKHMQVPAPDILKCSKLFHSLIQLSLSGSASQDISSKEEAWNYYMEIFDFIDNTVKESYPEMELVWLMTKAWNCGINFYSSSRYVDAEKWCGMSMRILKYLATFRDNYHEHMNNVYGEVLAKIEAPQTTAILPAGLVAT